MQDDRYAIELERAIHNWYYNEELASPEPLFNSIMNGVVNGMHLIVPFEDLDSGLSDKKRVVHIASEKEGKYYIPVFTSINECAKGGYKSYKYFTVQSILSYVASHENCEGFIINTFGKQLSFSNDMIRMMTLYRPISSTIQLVRGSVADMHVGAIVNAANSTLMGGGGIDGVIHASAGIAMTQECATLNGCDAGDAKITGAYNITYADYIIHTVGPIYSSDERDAQILASCYTKSLDIAYKNECLSIAFPCISTGAFGYPINKAADVALKAIRSWIAAHNRVIMNIYLCCYRENEYEAYKRIIA